MMKSLQNWSQFLAATTTGIGIVLVAGCAVAYFLQEKFLYRSGHFGAIRDPKRNPEGSRLPSDRSIPFLSIQILTEDAVLLKGWLMLQPQSVSVPTIIFFQGSGGNIGQRLNTFELLYKQLGVNVLTVSYRGYGESEGEATEEGLKMDISAILNWAFERSDIDTGKIVVQGRSLGGAAAIYAVQSCELPVFPNQVKGLIVENTFLSVYDVVGDIWPHIAVLRPVLLRNYWPSFKRIASISCPILFVSGEADELIPPYHMRKLHENATSSPYRPFVMQK